MAKEGEGIATDRPGAIWSIDASRPFLTTLAARLLDGTLIEGFKPADDPLLLSRATIYLPTRRAARALTGEFLGLLERDATILPRILTIGDATEDGLDDTGSLDDLPVIPGIERQLTLARLVLMWTNSLAAETRALYGDEDIVIPSSRADAIRFAGMLCDLMDQFETGEVTTEAVFELDVEDQAGWWALTTAFFRIVFHEWPGILDNLGYSDPAKRRRLLIDRRSRELAEQRKGQGSQEASGSRTGPGREMRPVIAAGSTGSIPATARFLAEIASLEQGAVVLPGVDFNMSDAAFESLLEPKGFLEEATMPTHPQFGFAKLLASMGVSRSNVKLLAGKASGGGPDETAEPSGKARNRLVSTSMLPSRFAQIWHENGAPDDALEAFADVTLIEAKGERQEAAAIALALRQTLETPDKTAALVTPDRNLAKRVALEMRRHGVRLDDSGGEALSRTEQGRFVRLVLAVLDDSFETVIPPINIAALMKHPLCRLGRSRDEADQLSRLAELVLLRGQVNRPGAGSLAAGINRVRLALQDDYRAPAPVKAMDNAAWEAVTGWCEDLDSVFLPLQQVFSNHDENEDPENKDCEAGFHAATKALFDALCTLSTTETGEICILEEEAGHALDAWFSQAVNATQPPFMMSRTDFASAIDALLDPVSVRKPGSTHPRLHIYGPLEARLQQPDLMILGGLNEGTWPQSATNDPFLNRPMKLRLKLDPPERRVGLSAHDFQQFIAAPEVMLTRADRVNNTPAIASRWIQKLVTVVGDKAANAMRARGNAILHLADKLEQADPDHTAGWRELVIPPAQAPKPVPPLAARPQQLAVTDVETLIRDPYALYAKKILALRPLPPLHREADALLRGIVYHDVLAHFQTVRETWINASEETAITLLMSILDQHLEENEVPLEAAIFWRQRLQDVAGPLLHWEKQRAGLVKKVLTETDGRIDVADLGFVLTARADRIDVEDDGGVVIIDYKTGTNPSVQMARTLSPQLLLEALIAERGGFALAGEINVSQASFIRLIQENQLKVDDLGQDEKHPLDEQVAKAELNLCKLIYTYRDADRPYVSRYAVHKDAEMSGDYDHLARVREWSIADVGDGDGGDDG